MCKPVTSMEEIIEAIKEGVRSANLPIRDTDEDVPVAAVSIPGKPISNKGVKSNV